MSDLFHDYKQQAVDAVINMLKKRGWNVVEVKPNETTQDQGNLLVYKYFKNGRPYLFQFINVRREHEWKNGPAPGRKLCVAQQDQIPPYFWYFVFCDDLSRYAFFDMTKIRQEAVEYDGHVGPDGTSYVNAGIPLSLGVIKDYKP